MKTLRIAYYKKSKTIFGKLIRVKQYRIDKIPYSSAQYSHVELCFDDGWFYGSSEVDGGVRAKKIKVKEENWDFVELKLTNKDYLKIREYCESQVNNRYNYAGIFFAQVLNTRWFKREGDVFCSEFVTKALQQLKMLCGVDALFINPAQSHLLITKL